MLPLLFCLLLNVEVNGLAADFRTVWQLGLPDGQNSKFALTPDGYKDFHDDGFYVVRSSDPKLDWPYVHPGPGDGWAGARPHTFTFVFGLQRLPSEAAFRLVLDFLDTHSSRPPRLRVFVNGRKYEEELPQGAGDDSVFGDPSRGLG